MLTQQLRDSLKKEIKEEPRKIIEILEKDPKILEILLKSDEQIQNERNERIKYINMTAQMDFELRKKAEKLKITQGALIGAAIFSLLLLFEK